MVDEREDGVSVLDTDRFVAVCLMLIPVGWLVVIVAGAAPWGVWAVMSLPTLGILKLARDIWRGDE